MKKIAFSFIILFASLPLFAQNNYNEAIQQGDAAFNRAEYPIAIQKYLVARTLAPNKIDDVKGKLDKVYIAINTNQKELDQTKTKLENLQAELAKTNKQLTEALAISLPKIPPKDEIEHIEKKIEQVSTKLLSVEQDLTEAITQRDELEKRLEDCESKNSKPIDEMIIEPIETFTKMLPKLTYGFLKANYPKKVCKELKFVKPKGGTYIGIIVNKFIKGDSSKKQEIIDKTKHVLNSKKSSKKKS